MFYFVFPYMAFEFLLAQLNLKICEEKNDSSTIFKKQTYEKKICYESIMIFLL